VAALFGDQAVAASRASEKVQRFYNAVWLGFHTSTKNGSANGQKTVYKFFGMYLTLP
jgi:hypothetical protein